MSTAGGLFRCGVFSVLWVLSAGAGSAVGRMGVFEVSQCRVSALWGCV